MLVMEILMVAADMSVCPSDWSSCQCHHRHMCFVLGFGTGAYNKMFEFAGI